MVEAFRRYGVDGVMIARAGLGRPWLFAQCAAALRGEAIPPEPSLEAQRELVLRHHREVEARFGEERGNILMRKYASTYAQGKRGAREFRTYVNHVKTSAEFREVVERYFPREFQPQPSTATAE